MSGGRFAPTPTSQLHIGNLRTALVAWLLARSTGRAFRMRIEDLDVARVRAAGSVARHQLADLALLGITWDGEIAVQSDRTHLYSAAAASLPTYECFCTRREIAEAASAPHNDGYRPYPGTCRNLSDADRARLGAERPPALRVRAGSEQFTVDDRWAGSVSGVVDDFVIRRGDGAWAYNLATVVDDLAQGVDQVCRGDDLLSSSPRQAWLIKTLGGEAPEYAHVGLVVNATGSRLAKRDGAVSLSQLATQGMDADGVRSLLGASLRLNDAGEPVTMPALLARFDPDLAQPEWTWPTLSA